MAKGKTYNRNYDRSKNQGKGKFKGKGQHHGQGHGRAGGAGVFPYGFVERDGGKKAPEAFHHCLEMDRFDLAFEVRWTLQTPAALNPCTEPGVSESMPVKEKGEFAGYNKRWLMVDGRPAISPFTVKSAVANGFANLVGGCYRVITREEGHTELKEGGYPYNGGWKRYRVDMARSYPAIVRQIEILPDQSRKVNLQPVVEYYYDEPKQPEGFLFEKEKKYFVRYKNENHKNIVKGFFKNPKDAMTGVIYYGPYRFGMNLSLEPGDLGKKHHNRFYQNKGAEIAGVLSEENFVSADALGKKVYVGKTKRLAKSDRRRQGLPWHEDLSALEPGDWVYYQEFDGQVGAVGRCFQFKALFFHEDAVPEQNRLCKTVDRLCPRCAMFGMSRDSSTEDRGDAKSKEVGFKGRFKSCTLVCDSVLQKANPKWISVEKQNCKRETWTDEAGKTLSYQTLLPIMTTPKPNKRDKANGYFNDQSGRIKGAKVYRFGERGAAEQFDVETGGGDYRHGMRNWAHVCDKGMCFDGVLGAENCSLTEAAAFLVLLEHGVASHGFKLGLGKALGMGNAVSEIRKVWVRKAEDYAWRSLQVQGQGARIGQALEPLAPGISGAVDHLKKKHDKLCKLEQKLEKPLQYPKPSPYYWKNAR